MVYLPFVADTEHPSQVPKSIRKKSKPCEVVVDARIEVGLDGVGVGGREIGVRWLVRFGRILRCFNRIGHYAVSICAFMARRPIPSYTTEFGAFRRTKWCSENSMDRIIGKHFRDLRANSFEGVDSGGEVMNPFIVVYARFLASTKI